MHQLTIKKQAIKALLRMSIRDAHRVRSELSKSAEDPERRRDIDVVLLKGRPGFRLRVGNWRIIYERIEHKREINILRIGPRGDIYKG